MADLHGCSELDERINMRRSSSVRAADGMAHRKQDASDGSHTGAADAKDMDALWARQIEDTNRRSERVDLAGHVVSLRYVLRR